MRIDGKKNRIPLDINAKPHYFVYSEFGLIISFISIYMFITIYESIIAITFA